MEIIGFGITVAAVIWGAVEVMKHFFPSWSDAQEQPLRRYIHERIDGVEDEIDVIKKNMERVIDKVESP